MIILFLPVCFLLPSRITHEEDGWRYEFVLRVLQLMPHPLEEFWKALARLPLPLAEHDLESDDTIPYIIRHELAAHEPRLAELPEETPSFVVRRPRKANSTSSV